MAVVFTWNLHVIPVPECTAHFKLFFCVKCCHMRGLLVTYKLFSVFRDLLSSLVLKPPSPSCDKEAGEEGGEAGPG